MVAAVDFDDEPNRWSDEVRDVAVTNDHLPPKRDPKLPGAQGRPQEGFRACGALTKGVSALRERDGAVELLA
jgi:hypothetical protein